MKIVYPKKDCKDKLFSELPLGSTFLNTFGKLRMKVQAVRTLVTQVNVNTINLVDGSHYWTEVDEKCTPVNATVTFEVE